MLFKDGQLREKYRSLSPNSLRVLAWQEDQYERPLRIARYEKKRKRKMADRTENNNGSSSSNSRHRRSRSPRKRAKPSHGDSYEDVVSDEEDAESLDPTLTQDAFSAAISLNSQSIPNLPSAPPVQQVSPSLSRSSRTSPTRQSQSTTYSRTPSPSKGGQRQKRIALEFTTPKFYSGLPEHPTQSTVDELDEIEGPISPDPRTQFEIPEQIATLIRDLSETAATPGCIPTDLEAAIHTASHGTEVTPDGAFSPNRVYGNSIDSTRLLHIAQEIHAAALKTHKSHRDEQAWYPIVRTMLESPLPSTFLEVDESQTRSVCSELLPLAGMAGTPIASVKTDHVLQFNRDNEKVARVLNPLFGREPGLNVSAFNDPVAAKTFTAAVVEVKSPGGDYDEGVYQLAVTSAAVLARLRLLEVEGGLRRGGDIEERDEMPVVGWVVHGHFWYLHVTYRQFDGSIRVLGPFPSGNTATYLGIFRLMRIMTKLKHWVAATYWPYLRGLVEARGRTIAVAGFADSLPAG